MLISSNLIVGNGRGSYRTNSLQSTKEVRIGTGKNGSQLAVERLTVRLPDRFTPFMLTSVYIDEQAPTRDLLFEQSRNAVTAANAEKGRN